MLVLSLKNIPNNVYIKGIIDRIKFPFRKEKELYSCFYKILGFYPSDIHYYKQAIHHKSSSYKKEGSWINNERLEFLGDAILDAIISDVVFQHFKGKREGFLTNTRSKIVQRETLNKVAVEIKLDKLIISSTHSHSHNSYIYGNAFEALIGAIYLDKGYIYCKRFVERRILKRLINIDKLAYKEVNFKSKLIEWGQKKHIEICFDLIEESKEDTCTPIFITQARIGDIIGGTGRGYSKKESQQIAAQNALKLIKDSPNLFISTNQEDQIENSTD
ncbi:MAG: ribonuclease III [Paraprevotella sp.]|nr:ribonuclease III [Paraprevotella sp.]